MPIYEFACPVCETKASRLCKIGEVGAGEVCGDCGHMGLSKQLSLFCSPGTGGQSGCSGCIASSCGGCSRK